MLWDFIAMLWYLFAMLWNVGLNDVCFALVCYEIWIKSPPYTEEFHIFRSKMIRSHSLSLIRNATIYSLKQTHVKLMHVKS